MRTDYGRYFRCPDTRRTEDSLCRRETRRCPNSVDLVAFFGIAYSSAALGIPYRFATVCVQFGVSVLGGRFMAGLICGGDVTAFGIDNHVVLLDVPDASRCRENGTRPRIGG